MDRKLRSINKLELQGLSVSLFLVSVVSVVPIFIIGYVMKQEFLISFSSLFHIYFCIQRAINKTIL